MQIAPRTLGTRAVYLSLFLSGLIVIVSALQLPSAVLPQTSGPDDFAHFT